MKTTIYFYISKKLQKKLLSEGQDAKNWQSIELDITDQKLINLAEIDENGNAKLKIDSFCYHYDENESWEKEEHYFNFVPGENDLIVFFAKENMKKIRDEEIDEEKEKSREEERKIREAEEEKERIEKEKEKKAKEEQQKKTRKEIDFFVDQQGSEKLKLRKELGYEYKHLAINEMIDQIECKYEKTDTDDYDSSPIYYPSEKMMQAEKKLLKNKFVKNVRCVLLEEKENEYNYDEEKDRMEAFRIDYNLLGYEKTRYYKFK